MRMRGSPTLASLALVTSLGALFLLGFSSSRPYVPQAAGHISDLSQARASNMITGFFVAFTILEIAAVVVLMLLARGGKASRKRKYIEPRRLSLIDALILGFLMSLVAGIFLSPFLIRGGKQGFMRPLPKLETTRAEIGPKTNPVQPEKPPGSSPTSESRKPPRVNWLWLILAISILVILASRGVNIYREEHLYGENPSNGEAEGRKRESLADAIGISLMELDKESDPRRAIIACYNQFQILLHREGLPMPAHYTPEEYLYDALKLFQVSFHPLWTLTALFERARFSTHDMTMEDKSAALESLKEIREALIDVRNEKERE